MTLRVGIGVLARMQQSGDHPMRDSDFSKNADGTEYEQGYGTKGNYRASNATGQWETVGPLPDAE
jgi:hypothetical protein